LHQELNGKLEIAAKISWLNLFRCLQIKTTKTSEICDHNTGRHTDSPVWFIGWKEIFNFGRNEKEILRLTNFDPLFVIQFDR
jgi:hypothetical protein